VQENWGENRHTSELVQEKYLHEEVGGSLTMLEDRAYIVSNGRLYMILYPKYREDSLYISNGVLYSLL
jgi:hypothetical protein